MSYSKSFHITFRPSNCSDDIDSYSLTKKDIETMLQFIESKNSAKYYVVVENPKRISAHIHVALLLSKNVLAQNIRQQILNRYRKYIKFKHTIGKNRALDVKAHPEEQLHILAGGYHAKDRNTDLIKNIGFTAKELGEGKKDYNKSMINKQRKRKIELTNKNFVQKLDDYLFMNNIKYDHMEYNDFINKVITQMLNDNYIFSVSPKQIRLWVLQFLKHNKKARMIYLSELTDMDTVFVSDKDVYVRIMTENSNIY